MDAVLLDERSSLSVPAIHGFLKAFFPKLAHHVLTEQTCSLIDNLVGSLTSMVDVVDIQATAFRLTGDLRALALVYSSSTQVKPPANLQLGLDTLLARTKSIRMKETKQHEAESTPPSKKRKIGSEDKEKNEDDEEATNSEEDNLAKECTSKKTKAQEKSSEEDEAKCKESVVQSEFEKVRVKAVTSTGCSQSSYRSASSGSWLEMLEKAIAGLQVIVQMQVNN